MQSDLLVAKSQLKHLTICNWLAEERETEREGRRERGTEGGGRREERERRREEGGERDRKRLD